MTKRDLFAVFLKILGVVYATMAAFNLASLFFEIEYLVQPSVKDTQFFVSTGATVALFVLILGSVFVLFRWGDGIAHMLVRDDAPLPPLDIREWEKPLFILSLRVAGVVCLISGVPGVIYHLYQFIIEVWSSWFGPGYGTLSWSHFLKDIVLVVLGAYLLRGGNHVVKYVFREPKVKHSENTQG